MRARSSSRVAAVLAATVASAAFGSCVRQPDPLELDSDVVSVAIMLVAGEREAFLLAAHAHRQSDEDPPTLAAALRGPGWTATFSDTVELRACTLTEAQNRPGPEMCLRAVLPEEIRGGEKYGIEGTAPIGPFSGEVVLPAVPILIEPGDTLHLSTPTDYEDHLLIPLRYRIGSDVGTLLADVLDIFRLEEDGTETELEPHYVGDFSRPLEGPEADTVRIEYFGTRPLRFSLRLLGIGWNHTNFAENEGIFPLPRPWPSFGIDGEGVYGYFDGVVPSRVSRVWVQ
ncbi:MAG: hypothetical protein OXG58_07355 [Gemmatimonadetes bacterium]|nr:hypothetical protein [Gemmatimonadota bacterium]MCY3944470.1 hypothetical protein [Gemmatimonadota bacterium]